MFSANPRLAVLFAALTAIGLVSATSVLLAYPAKVVATPGLPIPETAQGLSESSPNSASQAGIANRHSTQRHREGPNQAG